MQPRRTTGAILVAFCLLWVSPATGLPGDEPEVATPPPQALLLWQQGYALHLVGRYQLAARFFRKSIEIHPTAEAHTFLGWSLSYPIGTGGHSTPGGQQVPGVHLCPGKDARGGRVSVARGT